MGRNNACILCHTSVAYSTPEFEGYRICRTCDLTWCIVEDPADPSSDWEEKYYGRADVLQLHEARKSGIKAIMARLKAVCPHKGQLLDVGTGLGILMSVAATDGWLVEGIEPSKSAAKWAHKMTGAPVYNDFLENLKLPDAHYDAITVLDTLRSVPDPLAFLNSARKLLRPGGVMVIREVYRGFLRRTKWLTNRSLEMNRRRRGFDHAQSFSPKSLLYALQAVGLHGWVEPSPVFVERASTGGLMASLSRRMISLASATLYQGSARRIIISPNLLAFGRAPMEANATHRSALGNSLHAQ